MANILQNCLYCVYSTLSSATAIWPLSPPHNWNDWYQGYQWSPFAQTRDQPSSPLASRWHLVVGHILLERRLLLDAWHHSWLFCCYTDGSFTSFSSGFWSLKLFFCFIFLPSMISSYLMALNAIHMLMTSKFVSLVLTCLLNIGLINSVACCMSPRLIGISHLRHLK